MILNDMKTAEQALSKFVRPVSKNYNLDAIRALLVELGNPQDSLRVVHVAGTSGKTSTSYYAAALIASTGHSVGLSVSPHIDTVRERTQVNGGLIEESKYLILLGEFLDIVAETGIDVSYFELLVAFSYWVWAKLGLEYAVVEVGLGGLLDGTNVVTRSDKICIITDIGYDHQDVLGETLPEIAAQKAGIILPNNSVFMYEQSREVMDVVRSIASEKAAIVVVVPDATVSGAEHLSLFQKRNSSLAYAAVQALGIQGFGVKEATSITVPGRMERQIVDGIPVFLDGSHNGQKIGALVESFREKYPGLQPVLVVSFGKNRSDAMREGLQLLRVLGDRIIATNFTSQQDMHHESLAPAEIAERAKNAGFKEIIEVPGTLAAVQYALSLKPDAVLLVGSFYALLEVRSALEIIQEN